ncbi:YdbL family protein [Shewanella olleyana]|uniref:YdbL family protein n=1 Tax=Shewanella olleyana TaxID=135626 RepID=UPI00200E511B|nr:YdbL family protein [Shewanella olleyana]MCL1067952.1 YdbL family protein [Shewanella olleyana]
MKLAIIALLTGLLVSVNAYALTLQQAKSQGLVGEQTNGYLGLVVNNTEAKQLMTEVNAKRKQHYQKIAKKNKLSTSDVANRAAKKAIAAADKNHFIQNSAGKWQQK